MSNGSCYQGNLYSYNQTTFNGATNCTTNSYDQAAINRRKNATRETTNTLKAWLYEHRKNPYPTKGEKIMLAIITKMTLTQVSTWFANARRRLKKENKMTWEPRNKCNSGSGDEEDSSSDIEYVSAENETGAEMATVLNDGDAGKRAGDAKSDADQDHPMSNGRVIDEQPVNGRPANKCEDSDSNTSSNLKRNNSPTAFENGYGKSMEFLNLNLTLQQFELGESFKFFKLPGQRKSLRIAAEEQRTSLINCKFINVKFLFRQLRAEPKSPSKRSPCWPLDRVMVEWPQLSSREHTQTACGRERHERFKVKKLIRRLTVQRGASTAESSSSLD